jgi:hypothetical protein
MSLPGIMSSPYQRNLLLLASILIILLFSVVVVILWYVTPETRGWNLVIDFLVAIVASAIFALASALYLAFFFKDPFELASASKLLPQDIGQALLKIAENASDYRLFVRTGRHFRADILPVLIRSAMRSRRHVRIEAVLLDFRDDDLCEKYATYRKNASFDAKLWTKEYVQKEVLATILKLIDAAADHSSLISIDLYLSKRLSTFRIDGSSDEIIVTREDPKDTASRYCRVDNDYAAFLNEFNWTRDAAFKVKEGTGTASLPAALEKMLDESPLVARLAAEAAKAKSGPSPYAR